MDSYEIINLSKKYKEYLVLDEISFNIHQGEILSILGKNGEGKTTLIKILTRLLNKTSGEILFNGKNIETINKKYYYRHIGVMLEGERNLYWYMSGQENIDYFCGLMGMKSKEIKEESEKLLKRFDLFKDKDKAVGVYSKGMKQKLSLIIAIMHKPKVIFLDEPTVGLDIVSKRELVLVIKELSTKHNITVILTSHELDVVEQISDRLLILDNKKIKFIGQPKALAIQEDEAVYSIEFKGEIEAISVLNLNYLYYEKLDDVHKLKVEKGNLSTIEIIQILENNHCELISINTQAASLEDLMYKMWGEQE